MELRRESSAWELVLTALAAGDKGSEAYESAKETAFVDRQNWVLDQLFLHFGLNRNEEGSWESLARQLALKHVPAMRVASNRRLSKDRLSSVDRKLRPRQLGRPSLYGPEKLKAFLEHVVARAKQQGLAGRGARAQVLREIARACIPPGKPQHWRRIAERTLVRNLARRLSDAAALYPEIAAKLDG